MDSIVLRPAAVNQHKPRPIPTKADMVDDDLPDRWRLCFCKINISDNSHIKPRRRQGAGTHSVRGGSWGPGLTPPLKTKHRDYGLMGSDGFYPDDDTGFRLATKP